MNFDYSDKVKTLQARLIAFMDEHIYPNEKRFYDEIAANRAKGNAWIPTKIVEELKPLARKAGLWNLFLPHSKRAPEGLSNLEYAPLCEIMGRVPFAAEVFNCNAPDTGNMETFERYASEALKDQWLEPLLKGEIRSAFLMTEPDVASSDATNIQCSIKRDGDHYVINGRKWWSSGAGDPRCAVYIVMGKTDPDAPRHSQQSMIIVPANSPGIEVIRPLSVFGYDDAPHGHMEVDFKNVRVPTDHILLGLMLKALGRNPKEGAYVAFAGGGPANAAIIGGQVAAGISGYSEFEEQIKGARMRALAVSGDSRIPGVNVLVHPECQHEVVRSADLVGSTERIIAAVAAGHEHRATLRFGLVQREVGLGGAVLIEAPVTEQTVAQAFLCDGLEVTRGDDLVRVHVAALQRHAAAGDNLE